VEAVASDGGKEVARVAGKAGSELTLAIPSPKLWSPDSPQLYDLRVTMKSNDKVVDEVTSYFGMRKIALGKDDKAIPRLMLNGKAVFQVGPLDQGFWPDGLCTAPTDEALRWDVVETKRLGFNCTRKHIKVEADRWYNWCDKLGLMVWQDMPSVNSYGGTQPIDVPQFKTELLRMVTSHWNHPSIIMWVLFNDLTATYERMLGQAWEMNASVGLAAVIYTQLTDLEKECNGLWTYDREVNKVIIERAAAANAGKGAPGH